MEQDTLAVFVAALLQVLKEMDIVVDGVEDHEAPAAVDSLLSSIGITGDLQGIFMLRTDAASAAAIITAMTGGLGVRIPGDVRGEMAMAGFGELSNEVAGRAMTLLFERGLRCDITAPAVVAAEDLRSLVPDLSASHRRTVRGTFGRLTMFLGMRAQDPLFWRKKTS